MTAGEEHNIDPFADPSEHEAAQQSAFLSPVSRIASQRASMTIAADGGAETKGASDASQEVESAGAGLPFGATSTLSALLRAGEGQGESAPPVSEDTSAAINDIAALPVALPQVNEEATARSQSQLAVQAQPEATTPLPDALSLAKKIASMLRPGPPFFSEMDNADLIAYIGDAKIMNGDAHVETAEPKTLAAATFGPDVLAELEDPAAGRQSVWAALESLPVGSGWTQIPTTLAAANGDGAEVEPLPSAGSDGDEGLWTALLLTCDLPVLKKSGDSAVSSASNAVANPFEIDTSSMKVELGRSVVLPTSVLKKTRFFYGNAGAIGRDIHVGQRGAPDSVYSWDNFSSPPPGVKVNSLDVLGMPLISLWTWPSWVPFLGKPKPSNPTPITADPNKGKKRIWIPSQTKVSFQAFWWGWRLWLPEPVMKTLTEDVTQVGNIAKVLSTVLSFLITHIPTTMIPPQLLPLVTVLQAIAPLTGYLATFIAWSWGGISSMDKGNGIVLSGTWILPIAAIPKAWDGPIVPDGGSSQSPAAPAPAPTPGTGAPATPTPAVAPAPVPAPETAPSVPVVGPLPIGGSPAATTT